MERLSIDEVMEHCRRVCENTELMAIAQGKTQDDITSRTYWEHYQVEEWLKELKEYKQLEEQCLLLRLPCKVGDTVYWVSNHYGFHFDVTEEVVEEIIIIEDEIVIHMATTDIKYGRMNNTVFLTREEAEQALKQMKGE